MTSVGNTGASTLFQTQRTPPPKGNPVAQAISNEVSIGSISAADGTALSNALTSIDASLESGRSGSSSNATRLDPSQIQDRISSLIDDQVSSGVLTSEQAETLSSLFEANAPGQGGASATGGPGGAGGPPPGPPPTEKEDTSASSSTDSSASVSDLLDTFMKSLQESQSKAMNYAASGTTTSSTGASALLFDFTS